MANRFDPPPPAVHRAADGDATRRAGVAISSFPPAAASIRRRPPAKLRLRMNRPSRLHRVSAFWLHLLAAAVLAAALGAAEAPAPMPFIGGGGGVYLLAEPGELVIEVDKRDLNRRDANRTELRAILAGPDRRVLQELIIPDDGLPSTAGVGPTQTGRLSTRVDRPGIHVLNLTVSQDRYGQEAIWRFRTNAKKYLIATARGHRDARHEEPIILAAPEQPVDVCFWPRRGAFAIEYSRVPANRPPPRLLDATGATVAVLPVAADGQGAITVPAEHPRTAGPWRLHFPSAKATLQIDGLTRWDDGDPHPDFCLWTPDAASWFAFADHRWLLTPYQQNLYGAPGERRAVAYQVRNDAPGERTLQFALEFPGAGWPVQLSADRLVLRAGESATVTATGTVPPAGQSRTAHLRATPLDDSGFTTYSTLTLTAGRAPAGEPLAMPIVLRPYAHENEQFGYAPDYPTEQQMYFSPTHQPFVRTATGVATRRDGAWHHTIIDPRSSPASTKVSFDREGRIYVLGTTGSTTSLYTSTDGGRTFSATPLSRRERASRACDLEVFTGHNPLSGPPPIIRYTMTAKDEKIFWRSLNDLELFLPRIEHGRVVPGDPILVTRECIGFSTHSGAPASVVSRGDKVHVVWGEATDPNLKVPGVPVRAATYDRHTRRLSEAALLGHGPPANDAHNTPSITMDGTGVLHVLGGTHGRPFPYARSLEPNDAAAGWTPAVLTGEAINQTYIGLVCDSEGTLHTVFRWWRYNQPPFPASTHATLAHQRKRPGQPWEQPRILVVSPFSEYSIFYHRLTIDRRGRLFLSYDYWSTFWFYRNDLPARRRTLLLSPDGGESWKLAESSDFR